MVQDVAVCRSFPPSPYRTSMYRLTSLIVHRHRGSARLRQWACSGIEFRAIIVKANPQIAKGLAVGWLMRAPPTFLGPDCKSFFGLFCSALRYRLSWSRRS